MLKREKARLQSYKVNGKWKLPKTKTKTRAEFEEIMSKIQIIYRIKNKH